jgi:hypothetical protein
VLEKYFKDYAQNYREELGRSGVVDDVLLV